MAVNRDDGKFQACYWLSADGVGNDPDEVEYSDILMELKARAYLVFRQGRFQYRPGHDQSSRLASQQKLGRCERRICIRRRQPRREF